MNAMDRLIGWVSPKWGAKRAMARARMQAARAYFDGATTGRRGASIRRSLADANAVTARTLPRLRAGSRDLVRNNPHARRGVEAIVSNTVGTGIAPQFLRDGHRAEDIEQLADLHLETTDCDADGRHTFAGLQAAGFWEMVESGEVLVRRRWRRTRDALTVPVQFQLLEPDYLDHAKDVARTETGGSIVQGVEFDRLGRRRAYWLYSEHPGSTRFTGVSKPVPATDVIHAYRVDRPGQARGIPWLSSVMLRLADFADYEDAQLVRQKIAACFVGFVHESFDGGYNPVGVSENDDGQLIDQLEPGIMERLPPGTDVTFGQPPQVSGFEEYVRVSLRAIAMGLGVSYEAIAGDLRGVNFSSGKMGRLEFQRNIDAWRMLTFVPQFCDPLARWFLEAAAMTGADTEGVKVRHIAPRNEMIDPPREGRAQREMVRSGQK
ncbi:MAG TPA: phage portal protein, partial [Longimicrobiales bacterium]|nr:phage portal protein [Longimicrobiales bacterium]